MKWRNTTIVSNDVFDTYLKELNAAELKLLLCINRYTLGWRDESTESKRKEIEWISSKLFQMKTGCSKRAIVLGVKNLVQKRLIEVTDEKGNLLEHPSQRKGQRYLHYRLSQFTFPAVEKEGIAEEQPVTLEKTNANFASNLRKNLLGLAQKMRITK